MEMLLLFAAGICFLLHPQLTAEGVRTGLQVCSTAILPALFPFFVLTDYWIKRGHADRLSAAAGTVMEKVFHLPGSSASAFLLGTIGGYPVGARTLAQLYSEGQLTKEEAEQALYFSNNAGPAFVLGVMGSGLFQSILAGIILYLIHLSSSVLIGILLRPKKSVSEPYCPSHNLSTPMMQGWTDAIVSGGQTALQVCTFVVFFAILVQLLQNYLPQNLFGVLLIGGLELAGGTNIIGQSILPAKTQFILASFLLGWGGLCVMMQSLALLHRAKLSGRKLLIGKLCQGSLSLIFSVILVPFLPLQETCISLPTPRWNYISWALSFIILLFGLFLKESTGKTEKNRL